MKISKKLLWVIPVAAAVLALGTGAGMILAKNADQAAGAQGVTASYVVNADNGTANPGPLGYCGGWAGMQGTIMQQAATLMGTTAGDLQTQLNSGKTLAEIGAGKGISQDQLINAIMTPFQERMDLMLKNGYLTQAQVDSMIQQMQQRAESLITGNVGNGFYGGGMMQGNRGGMMGGWGNFQPANPQQPGAAVTPGPGGRGMMGWR